MTRRSPVVTALGVLGLMAALSSGAPGRIAQAAQDPATGGQTSQPPAAPQTPPADQPVFRSGINFVRVDVIVSDKNGNPIENLKPEDFEVVEQNQPQKIETFKLISLDGGLMPGPDGPPRQIRNDIDEETEASRDDVRLFAIFLDDYHVRKESSMSARGQLARFVETQLGPSDMVGLMYPLQPVGAVRMTRNHDAIQRGLEQFVGRKFDYKATNQYEEEIAFQPAEVIEQVRNQISMSAIKSLIMHMGGLKEGRKALILVSEGFTAMLPPQLRDPNGAAPGLGNPNHNNPMAGDGSVIEERAATMASFAMNDLLRDIWDVANKNNTAIYAVDPRGLATNEFGIDQNISNTTDRQYLTSTMETLQVLSANTDGRAIVNRNDLTLGMKQIVRDSSAYYLLGYNSTFTATDGKFHEIKVRVKRPGVQVRARKGYWAYTADDAARALAPPKAGPPKAVEMALAAIAPSSRSRAIRTWIGTERGTNGKTKVTFVWEPMPKMPGEQVRAADTPARVSLTAVAPDGSPIFRGRVPDGNTPATPAAPSRVSFEVPPGQVQLRVAVESGAADVMDSEVREITVPDLTGPRTLISTPVLFRGRTLPELQRLKADPLAMPTSVREFNRTERVFIRLHAYGPGISAPTVKAKLLNRTGQSMSDLPVTAAVGTDGTTDIDLALATLPPGEYLVEITATGEGEPVKELVGFRGGGLTDMRFALTLALALGAGVPQAEVAGPKATIDVVVQDARGQTSDSLGPADFIVTEDSHPLTIDAVRFVRATGTPSSETAPAALASPADESAAVGDTSRLFAIFLDEFHVSPGPAADRVRAALIRFVREDLGPGDLIVVLKPLDSLLDIRLTSDRDAVVRAIESFDPRRGDLTARTSFERNFIAGAPARVESARMQIAASSLDALATHLGRFNPPRKTLIVVSEGFLRSTRRRGDELLPTVDSVVLAANRAHVAIYPIDPQATEPGRPVDAPADGATATAATTDALRALGDRTAGRALTGVGAAVSVGLKQALSDASGYYVLTVSQPQTANDGRFHPVDVTVRRSDVTLRARPGYWSPSDENVRPARPSLTASFASQFVRKTSPLIRAWFGMSRADAGDTRVSFVWEPAPRVPGVRATTPMPARIALTVTTLDGDPVFDGVVMPANRGAADSSSVRQSQAAFEIPAGRLLVQMAIEDAGSRVLDRDVRDLVVGGFPGPLTIGSAQVLRARNAREFQALAADPAATPVATRQFSRAERLLVRVPVFSAGAQPVLSARLVSGLGASMGDLTVAPSPSPLTPFQLDVPLAALASGAYTIELTAKTPDGEAHESVPFRVTP